MFLLEKPTLNYEYAPHNDVARLYYQYPSDPVAFGLALEQLVYADELPASNAYAAKRVSSPA